MGTTERSRRDILEWLRWKTAGMRRGETVGDRGGQIEREKQKVDRLGEVNKHMQMQRRKIEKRFRGETRREQWGEQRGEDHGKETKKGERTEDKPEEWLREKLRGWDSERQGKQKVRQGIRKRQRPERKRRDKREIQETHGTWSVTTAEGKWERATGDCKMGKIKRKRQSGNRGKEF
jgi:hypothetical protein